jgi:hypothetical protein
MLSVLVLFWGVVFYTQGATLPLLAVMCITSCFALFLAFYTSWVSVKPGLLTTYSGPIPLDRKTRDSSEIDEIFCSLVRQATGRGVIERYALMAGLRGIGSKPVMILFGFVKEDDAADVGRILSSKLNASRPPNIQPVVFLQK